MFISLVPDKVVVSSPIQSVCLANESKTSTLTLKFCLVKFLAHSSMERQPDQCNSLPENKEMPIY